LRMNSKGVCRAVHVINAEMVTPSSKDRCIASDRGDRWYRRSNKCLSGALCRMAVVVGVVGAVTVKLVKEIIGLFFLIAGFLRTTANLHKPNTDPPPLTQAPDIPLRPPQTRHAHAHARHLAFFPIHHVAIRARAPLQRLESSRTV